MINGMVERKVIDGKVFVHFDDLLSAIFNISQQALDIAELTKDRDLTLKTAGVIELAGALDEILDDFKAENGLARYR